MKNRSLLLSFLFLLNLLTYMDRQVLAGVETVIAKDLLPDDPNATAKMGLCATAFLVSYMLFSPLFGVLGGRMSRWMLVGLGTIVGSVATAASGFAGYLDSFVFLLIMRCIVGISEAAYAPVAPSILSDLYSPTERGKVLSYFYVAVPVGSALGYALGGLAVKYASWQWAFFLLAPPGIALGLIALFIPDRRVAPVATPPLGTQPPLKERIRQALSFRAREYRHLFSIRSYVYCCLGMTAMTFSMGAMSFFMPRYVEQRYLEQGKIGGNLGEINITFGVIVVVAGLLATLFGGYLGDKLRGRLPGSYFIVSAAGLFVSFPMILLMLVCPFPFAWVFVFLAVFFIFFNTGPANTILANVTSPALRTTGFAVNIFIIHAFGDAISPFLLGVIADAYNMTIAFMVVSFMVFVGGVFWALGTRHLEADTAAASSSSEAVEPARLSDLPPPTTSSAPQP